MSAVTDLLEVHIEVLTQERAERRRMRKPVGSIQEQLTKAWDDIRRARAEEQNGSNEVIIKRARVDQELEKLMHQEPE